MRKACLRSSFLVLICLSAPLLIRAQPQQCQTSEREQLLFDAIHHQDATQVATFLAAGVNPNARAGLKFTTQNDLEVACMTALMQAAWLGDVQTAAVLLKAGADVDAKDNWGQLVWAYAVGWEVLRRIEADRVPDEMNRRLQLTELFLASGARLDLIVSGVWSPSYHAVQAAELTGDWRIFKTLVAAGAPVNSKDRSILADSINLSRTDLARARAQVTGKDGETEIIETLLAAGADVNAGRGLGTALREVANGSHLEGAAKRVKLLLASGADVNALDYDGATPLFAAIFPGVNRLDAKRTLPDEFRDQTEVIRLLLDAGANPNQKSKSGYTPIHLAVGAYRNFRAQYVWKSDVVFKMLIDRGAAVNAIDPQGNTALTLILSDGYNGDQVEQDKRLLLVKTLIAGRADVNLPNRQKQTPLSLAVLNANDEVVQTLMTAGADVNQRSQYGFTPLFMIAAGGTRLNVARLLIQAGAHVDLPNESGITPLLTALAAPSYGGNYNVEGNQSGEIIRLLIEAKANANAKDQNGNTVLMIAAKVGRQDETIQALLAAKANVNAQNDAGDSALIIAARRFGSGAGLSRGGRTYYPVSEAAIKALVAAGADVQTLNHSSESALTIIATNSPADAIVIMRELIAAAKRREGFAPRVADLLAAIKRAAGHSSGEMVAELIAAGANVNGVDDEGRPVLICAVRESGNADLVRVLLRAGARVDDKDKDGDTALIAAVREYLPGGNEVVKNALHRDPEVIRALLAYHPDISVQNEAGDSALTLAGKSGNQVVIGLLNEAQTRR